MKRFLRYVAFVAALLIVIGCTSGTHYTPDPRVPEIRFGTDISPLCNCLKESLIAEGFEMKKSFEMNRSFGPLPDVSDYCTFRNGDQFVEVSVVISRTGHFTNEWSINIRKEGNTLEAVKACKTANPFNPTLYHLIPK